MKTLLKATSQILFVLAGLLFFVGGRIVGPMANIDWILAEMLSIGAAVVLAVLGVVAKNAADNLDDGDPTSG